MVIKTSLKEYRAEQAERGLSSEDRLKRVTGGNERLKTHAWTDEQLQEIPENLVRFAFENSTALQKEFASFTTFDAYRKALVAGRAKIAR
jgi:hypothetical protein